MVSRVKWATESSQFMKIRNYICGGINRSYLKYVAISMVVLIAGCGTYPENLGLSLNEWNRLDQVQQDRIIDNSKQIEKELDIKHKKKRTTISNGALHVKMYGGMVMMPPFTSWESYQPTAFVIAKGECTEAKLEATANKDRAIALRSCFKGNILYLDASHYDPTMKYGSITITASPLWEQGFAYSHLNSIGYVRMKDVTVEIKQK